MEKKFGIFNTVEELNRAAAAQKAEGDLEALIGLATENGLEKEDAEDYMDSNDPEDCLCNATMAAIVGRTGPASRKPVKGLERLYRADADRVSGGSCRWGQGCSGKCHI